MGGRRAPGTLPGSTKRGRDVINRSWWQGGCRTCHVYCRRMIIQEDRQHEDLGQHFLREHGIRYEIQFQP